ncbi:unnamed protein product [Vitrella brassicaformis CCMP3155]|uniref:Uncharacterized protein n=1 Tax=Vitrella brassicaformis (strain CCMP3155) TaxID=1169540 RepID=A0A0G4FA07_VITBC|nr:unnamed protein product [Vitrella brassicaformis CCMP3155]|eukprot:CEM09710.1 unnamed protein product [Vitrella brassicaformis CCMP3155]
MDGVTTETMAAIQAQLLPRVEGYRLKQAQVNSCIDQLLQMDTAASMAPLTVAKVSRQFAAVSDLLAELAETINSTIALTRHRRTYARRLHLNDIPANPMSIILALSDLTAIAHLKSTARPTRNALRPIVRRLRLPKAIERAGLTGVVHFDDQLSHGDVMKAMWMVEEEGEGGWGEWMLVGRRVTFRRSTGQQDGTLELFRHNNEIRAIRNEPGFALTINPPVLLPNRPVHPFSQHPFTHHAKPHDPPVRSRIRWHHGVGWATVGVNNGPVFTSASCMLKEVVLRYRVQAVSGFTYSPAVLVDRRVRGGHLDCIMTRSPYTPPNGCADVMTWEAPNGACGQLHVLTTAADPFIAWINFDIPPGDNQNVRVTIRTTEAPAAGVANDAPFLQRCPLTAAMARSVLELIAVIVLDGQAP